MSKSTEWCKSTKIVQVEKIVYIPKEIPALEERWVIVDGGMYPFGTDYAISVTQTIDYDLLVKIVKRGEFEPYYDIPLLWRIRIQNWNFSSFRIDK